MPLELLAALCLGSRGGDVPTDVSSLGTFTNRRRSFAVNDEGAISLADERFGSRGCSCAGLFFALPPKADETASAT